MLEGGVAVCKWKPSVIWHSENPRSFEHVGNHTLSASYRNSMKSRMTQLLFQDALLHCDASKMKKYCLENNILSIICLSLIML